MNINATFVQLRIATRKFFSARGGNVAMIFALAAVPLLAATGAAIDYSHANSIKAAMQEALDSTALALAKTAASTTSDQLTTSAANRFKASFNRPGAQNVQISAHYDNSSGILSVSGSAVMPTSFLGVVGISSIPIGGLSKATMGSKIWPVCVLITASDQVHTLLANNHAEINFDNCMVQVNTTDWDAVAAKGSSYIHSTNGENCFVGEIHMGDVQPPKDPSCTFFPDPYAGMAMPASAATCTYTNFTTTGNGVTLQPGTYCGDTTLNGENITLAPGLYIFNGGGFTIEGNSNVTANGVTFVLTGTRAYFYITDNAQLTQTPMTSGEFAGFAFYLDNNSDVDACSSVRNGASQVNVPGGHGGRGGHGGSTSCTSAVDDNSHVTISGIVYLTNAAFLATDNAIVKLNGSLVANFLVALHYAQVSLTGALPNSSAIAAQMQKQSQKSSGSLRLVQ